MATLIINLRRFSVAIALSLQMSLSSFAYFSLPGHFVTLVLLLLQNLIQQNKSVSLGSKVAFLKH